MAPLVAELEEPYPMLIYGVSCFLSMASTFLLTKTNFDGEKKINNAK